MGIFKILICISLISFTSFCCKQTNTKEVYMLTENYEGVVYVIFNQKNGVPPKYEDGNIIFEIPKTGILKTQLESFSEEFQSLPEFFYLSNNQKKELPYRLVGDEFSNHSVQACCLSSGNFYKSDSSDPIPYQVFYIGTEKLIDSLYRLSTKIDLSKLIE